MKNISDTNSNQIEQTQLPNNNQKKIKILSITASVLFILVVISGIYITLNYQQAITPTNCESISKPDLNTSELPKFPMKNDDHLYLNLNSESKVEIYYLKEDGTSDMIYVYEPVPWDNYPPNLVVIPNTYLDMFIIKSPSFEIIYDLKKKTTTELNLTKEGYGTMQTAVGWSGDNKIIVEEYVYDQTINDSTLSFWLANFDDLNNKTIYK